jgi:MFS family permease
VIRSPMDPSSPHRSADNVTLLGWVAFWSGMGQEMVYPLLPTFVVVALGASAATLGAVEGALVVGVTLARLATARLLDRGASPRRLTRISYVLSLVARPLMAAAPGIAVVGSLRVLDGFGKGGKDAPRDTLVAADAGVGTAGASFGLQRALDTLGSVAGPLVAGGVLLAVGHGEAGLRFVFALAALPAVGALFALRRVHDTAPALPRPRGEKLELPRPFIVLLVAVTLFGLANSSDTLLLLRARAGGLSAAQLAFAYAAFNLAYAGLAIPAGRLSDRVGRRPLLLVAWSVYALVYTGFAFADHAWQLWVLFLAYGIYYAAAEGTLKAWVATLVPPERRGAAYGLYAAASGLLVLPASVLAGGLWDRYGPRPAFGLGAVLAALAVVVVAVSPSLRHQLAEPASGRAATEPLDVVAHGETEEAKPR